MKKLTDKIATYRQHYEDAKAYQERRVFGDDEHLEDCEVETNYRFAIYRKHMDELKNAVEIVRPGAFDVIETLYVSGVIDHPTMLAEMVKTLSPVVVPDDDLPTLP